MLCVWGEAVRPEGLGLVDQNQVQCSDSGIRFFCPAAGSRIRAASAGHRLLGFIDEEGKASVLTLRPGSDGLMGRSKTLDMRKDRTKLLKISCAEDHALLLTNHGRVHQMEGSGQYRLVRELLSRQVIQVACGRQHSMALTDDGHLFSWGQNTCGQLGLGRGTSSSSSPEPLSGLSGVPLAQISAGGEHSVVLSLSGLVFSWGRNTVGQLGLGHMNNVYQPTCLTNLNHERTVFVSCGEEHTATLTEEGRVYTFGSGGHGQLGHKSFEDELEPRLVTGLQGLVVCQISCGSYHTLALVEPSKSLYSFGRGAEGQQGNGHRSGQCVPAPVALPAEVNVEHSVQIIAGGNRSILLCSSQNTEENAKSTVKTLNSTVITRWVSDSGQWKKNKNEIRKIFSSAACWNASFSNRSHDGHARASADVDMEAVRAAFEQLAKKDAALDLVENVVGNDLLPSLSCMAVCEEALRVYIIIPELICVLSRHHNTKLTAPLASAILKVPAGMIQVLERYWSELQEPFLGALVELFRNEAAKLIGQIINDYKRKSYMDTPLQECVRVMQMIYKACYTHQREITSTDFIIHEINDLFDVLNVIQMDLNNIAWGHDQITEPSDLRDNQSLVMNTIRLLVASPCVFNLEAKCNLIKFRPGMVTFTMMLRRTELLEDCFTWLRGANEGMLRSWLQVVYCEDLKQTNVNIKDLFHNIFKELVAPESEMFIYNDANSLIWFPSKPSLPDERYFLLGILCGLAFNNNCTIHAPFPLALFKKLLDVSPSLEDLAELSPEIAQSMSYVLDYEDDDAENMDLFFTIEWDSVVVELDPEEPGKPVTSANKCKFVDAYVDYVLNRSVERLFVEFRRGFYRACHEGFVRWFNPVELQGVMVGSEDYDWSIFKRKTTYEGGFDETHPTIIAFWETFDEFTDKEKKAFLLFLTGFDQVPILGMEQVKMRVRPLYNYTLSHLPQALTCHAILELPVYPTKEVLQPKLLEAVKHKRGFWQE